MTYEQFELEYRAAHSDPRTRRWHLIAQVQFISFAITAIIFEVYSLIAISGAVGYAIAWASHALFEKNKPKSFSNPAWSIRAGRRMLWDEMKCLCK